LDVTQSQKLAREVKFVHYIYYFGRLNITITGKQSPLECNKLQVKTKMPFHPRKRHMEDVTTYRSNHCQIAHINTKNLIVTELDKKQQQDEKLSELDELMLVCRGEWVFQMLSHSS